VPSPPADPGGQERPSPPELPRTDDAAVDEALEELADVTSRPLDDQVEVYVGVHRRLQDRLADLDG
jgi:hypothetical protein